jgi:hypothetical protein
MSFRPNGFRPNEFSAKWVSAKRAFGQTSFGQTRLAQNIMKRIFNFSFSLLKLMSAIFKQHSALSNSTKKSTTDISETNSK